ncbi:DapH/DapD/GlmU-related protein [Cronobacter dublinensis]
MSNTTLYHRLSGGEPVSMLSPEYHEAIHDMKESWAINTAINRAEYTFLDGSLHPLFGQFFGRELDSSSQILPPVYIDFGRQVRVGKNVFINHNCTMMAAGGIVIDDDVQIGPQVTLTTTNHDFDDRFTLLCKPIHIKRNVWIGARALILPGVTVGENAVIAGGAVVTKDVEPDVVVGGSPARVLKRLD